MTSSTLRNPRPAARGRHPSSEVASVLPASMLPLQCERVDVTVHFLLDSSPLSTSPSVRTGCGTRIKWPRGAIGGYVKRIVLVGVCVLVSRPLAIAVFNRSESARIVVAAEARSINQQRG